MRRLIRRRRDERGFAAMMVATMVASGLFLGCAAFAVDVGKWYSEMARVQRAADAAALAGVPYLPYDLPNARAKALEVAKRNGYDDASPSVSITVEKGRLASQLRVTISSTITNDFGRTIGVDQITITKTAVADYKAGAPMGSPCNTFGNEPSAGTPSGSPSPPPAGPVGSARAASFANCKSNPQLWATVEGPQTDKLNGDRYQNIKCSTGTYGCSGGSNDEYKTEGYFWVIRVQPAAVGQPINLQLYDPAYVSTGQVCGSLPGSGSFDNNMNPYVTTDGKARYSDASTGASSTSAPYCSGDFLHSGSTPMTTTFVVRQQNDALDPMQGAVQNSTTGTPCIKQYTGTTTTPSYNALKSSNGSYNQQLARVFHNWTSMCTFIPPRSGDYYLQVRTNVSAAGAAESNTNSRPAMIYAGNTATATAKAGNTTAGAGVNSFSIRAVTVSGMETQVAVSGYDRMPMFANAASSSSTFNLIRVLPGAAGQYISFSFFDVSDISGVPNASGTVTVSRPLDGRGTIVSNPFPGGCKAEGGGAGSGTTLTNCSAPVTNANNNGKLETMTIPIPQDYDCDVSTLAGCWYQVTVSFPGVPNVNDITTWDATIVGDPVRLIE